MMSIAIDLWLSVFFETSKPTPLSETSKIQLVTLEMEIDIKHAVFGLAREPVLDRVFDKWLRKHRRQENRFGIYRFVYVDLEIERFVV